MPALADAGLLGAAAGFLKIGIMAFGGGISTVPLMRHEMIAQGLLEPGQFLTLLGLSQVTPGPLVINGATLLGFYKGGFIGAALCTMSAISGPLALLYVTKRTFSANPNLADRLDKAIRGPITGLLMMAFVYMAKPSVTDPMGVLLFLCSLGAASMGPLKRLYPLVVLAAGLAGAFLFSRPR
ncbi:chromate transporter [Thermanaerovibrio velox]|uniref:chromate transporter n=1 Tax=Thermanaerovibrio velox TaxID=108007 RepID=UPI003CCA8A2F